MAHMHAGWPQVGADGQGGMYDRLMVVVVSAKEGGRLCTRPLYAWEAEAGRSGPRSEQKPDGQPPTSCSQRMTSLGHSDQPSPNSILSTLKYAALSVYSPSRPLFLERWVSRRRYRSKVHITSVRLYVVHRMNLSGILQDLYERAQSKTRAD